MALLLSLLQLKLQLKRKEWLSIDDDNDDNFFLILQFLGSTTTATEDASTIASKNYYSFC